MTSLKDVSIIPKGKTEPKKNATNTEEKVSDKGPTGSNSGFSNKRLSSN